MRLIRFSVATSIVVVLTSAIIQAASASDRVAVCKGLEPTQQKDISESFKGKVEGKLGGLLGKLSGGVAGLEGEFKKVEADTLKGYPESHKLYVWQKIIYLACLDKSSGVDINDLAKAYLIGPGVIDLSARTDPADVEIEFAGLDSGASSETLSIYNLPNFRGAKLPDIVFSFQNSSKSPLQVQLDECSFVNFTYPRPIGGKSGAVSSITGTALMKAVGPYSVTVPPGGKRMQSYSIFSVDAPSFEARRSGQSVCKFRVGDDTISHPKDVTIGSEVKYLPQ